MAIETNLDFIKEMGEKKNEENWKFRSYLKNLDIYPDQLDKIVHKLNLEVSSQIDCTKCANCCMVVHPLLDKADIAKFSSGLNKSIKEFKSTFLTPDKEEVNKYNFNAIPCPFLKDNKCTNYSNRPRDCESFPHLQKKYFQSRLMGIIDFYSICPIVYNVYEQLKEILWHQDWESNI